MYISSIQQSNKNSIKFSLSTWTRSGSKASQSKFLHIFILIYSQHTFMKGMTSSLLPLNIGSFATSTFLICLSIIIAAICCCKAMMAMVC